MLGSLKSYGLGVPVDCISLHLLPQSTNSASEDFGNNRLDHSHSLASQHKPDKASLKFCHQ